jgi:plastocyanin
MRRLMQRHNPRRPLRRFASAALLAALLSAPAPLSALAVGDEGSSQATGPTGSTIAADTVSTSTAPAAPAAVSIHVGTAPDRGKGTAPGRGKASSRSPNYREAKEDPFTKFGFHAVWITNGGFHPASLTVHVGEPVVWTNYSKDRDHNVTGDDLDSGVLHPGTKGNRQSYRHTFTVPGTYNYECSLHPDMKGTVTVLARSSGTEGASGSGDSGGSGGGSNGKKKPSKGSQASSPDGTSASTATSGSGSSPASSGSSSLPLTGFDPLGLAILGLLLLDAGLAIQVIRTRRSARL